MTPLESLRAAQRDDTTLPSDARLTAYLRSIEPGQVALDRAARMTELEVRMLMHTSNA